MAVFVATLFIRPTMPRNNLSDANKYAGMIFFSLINMFFDGACPHSQCVRSYLLHVFIPSMLLFAYPHT